MPPVKKTELKPELSVTSTSSSPNESENADNILETDANSESIDSIKNKRSLSTENKENAPAKKQRAKPQPKIIENMQEYFDNGILDQLTTTTLRHWLKENQLHCTTRERKNSLIEKIRKYFLEGNSV